MPAWRLDSAEALSWSNRVCNRSALISDRGLVTLPPWTVAPGEQQPNVVLITTASPVLSCKESQPTSSSRGSERAALAVTRVWRLSALPPSFPGSLPFWPRPSPRLWSQARQGKEVEGRPPYFHFFFFLAKGLTFEWSMSSDFPGSSEPLMGNCARS